MFQAHKSPQRRLNSSRIAEGGIQPIPKTPERAVADALGASKESVKSVYLRPFLRAHYDTSHRRNLWQILTTSPGGLEAKINELRVLLNKNSDLMQQIPQIAKKLLDRDTRKILNLAALLDYYSKLADKIYEDLLGDQGMYCNLTSRGDITRQKIYTPHLGLTLLVERVTGVNFGTGTGHLQKAKNALVTLNLTICKLENFETFFKWGQNYHAENELGVLIKGLSDLPEICRLLASFKYCIELNANFLDKVIQYNHTKTEEISSPMRGVPNTPIRELYPYLPKQETPQQASPGAIEFNRESLTKRFKEEQKCRSFVKALQFSPERSVVATQFRTLSLEQRTSPTRPSKQ